MSYRTNPLPRSAPNPFRFRTSVRPRILHHFGANKSFTICTCRHPSCNPFRMRTYKNIGGGGIQHCPRQASFPPSHAPRDASIPCALIRLRILPVTTGVSSVGIVVQKAKGPALRRGLCHEPERLTYRSGRPTRSGCAGCSASRR